MIDISTLNDNQRKAFNWGDGPLLVLAGPGSGKTRVLACRVASLIEKTPGKYFKVLGLTSTNKAVAEIREWVAELSPNASKNPRTVLTTFHSFSARLLRQHGSHIGLRPDFTILDRNADRYSLLDEAIDRTQNGLAKHGITSEKLLPVISHLTESNVAAGSALEVLRRNSFNDPEALASVYENYRALMIEKNTLDFPGLIAEALSMLERKPGIREQAQRVYKHVCVDEFQNINLSQYRILCNLVDPSTKNLFVVADDYQTIYQRNGTSPEKLWKLREDFDMELLRLPENYRCPPELVELANKLITHNSGRSDEKTALKAKKEKESAQKAVRCQEFHDFEGEVRWVVRDIVQRPASERAGCVILAQTKKLLEKAVEELEKAKIPVCLLAKRKNEFESAPLQWLHSILCLANSRSSREYLRLACSAFFYLEGINLDVEDITFRAAARDGDYLRSFARVALDREELSPCARNIIKNAFPRLSERLDFWSFQKDAFAVWFDGLPSTPPAGKNIFDDYHEEKEIWLGLVNDIVSKYGGKQEITLHMFLRELDLLSKSPVPPQDTVSCFTIHNSKRMEFDHVYLIGMVNDHLPSWSAVKKGDNSREMQEERRNCFIAVTRAQKTLNLSYSSQVHGRERKPSRFLYEMGVLHSAVTGEQGSLSDQEAVCPKYKLT